MRHIAPNDLCKGSDVSRLLFAVMTVLRDIWQQQRIGSSSFADFEPVLLPTDHGAGRARRVLERLIAAERAQGS